MVSTREPRHWPALAALGATQTVGFGILYYAFAVFLTPMTAALHASTSAVAGALTLAVVVTALVAVPVGRWLDRHGGAGLMSVGSVLGTAAVLAWSQVDSLVELYLVFAVIGAASGMVLYEAAFAVIVSTVSAAKRPGALLSVTIVAGFASSIFLPLTGALVVAYGWRTALVILACIHGAITIPLHAFAVPRRRSDRTAPGRNAVPAQRRPSAVRTALRDPGFWILTGGFLAHAAAVAVIAVHIVAYLVILGHPATFAAAVAGLLGVLSVTGRLVSTGLGRRWSTTSVTAAIFAVQAGAAAALPLVGHSRAGAAACVVLFGLGFGVATIARPTLLADRYGTTDYATIAGALIVPATIAKAGAPLAAAMVAGSGAGYPPVLVGTAAACAVAALAVALHRRGSGRQVGPVMGPFHPAAGTGALVAARGTGNER